MSEAAGTVPSPRADLFRATVRLGARGEGTVPSHAFAENAR